MEVFDKDTKLIDYLSLKEGIILLLGETDTGKSTFAHNLIKALIKEKKKIAFIDSDIGQSTVGPPTTIGLKIIKNKHDLINKSFDELYFVGSTSPRGLFLPMVIGTYKLSRLFLNEVDLTIIDTTGLVHGSYGMALKFYKIELVLPNYIILFERDKELKSYKHILRNNNEISTLLLSVSKDVKIRSYEERKKYREDIFKKYFANSSIKTLDINKIPSFPEYDEFKRRIRKYSLIGLEYKRSKLLGLGIFLEFIDNNMIKIFTPVLNLEAVNFIRLGYTKVDFLKTE